MLKIIVVACVLLLMIGGGLYFLNHNSPIAPPISQSNPTSQSNPNPDNPPPIVPKTNLMSIIVKIDPTSGVVGVSSSLQFTATLNGGTNPVGLIAFTLYSDSACSVPVMSGTGVITDGISSWTTDWTPTTSGIYYLVTSYSGDVSNNGFETGCGDFTLIIS